MFNLKFGKNRRDVIAYGFPGDAGPFSNFIVRYPRAM